MKKYIDSHELAAVIERTIAAFLAVKVMSTKSELDNLCDAEIKRLYAYSGSAKIQKELDAVRERRIDFTN